MDAALLLKLLGPANMWRGACTIILDSNAFVQVSGSDAIAQGGLKAFAPRVVSGRYVADAVCLLPEHAAVLMVTQTKYRTQTGDDAYRQALVVADVSHVIAVEFENLDVLAVLGVPAPAVRMGFSSPIS